MTVSQEIERKFLVEALPADMTSRQHEEIIQGYAAIEDDREVRLRRQGAKYYLTVKIGSGLSRAEWQIGLGREQFETLWPATVGRRIEKVRYKVPFAGHTVEVDVYQGTLHGLMAAEVEFTTQRDSQTFIAPSWFSEEVTEDRRYKNKSLAADGRPK